MDLAPGFLSRLQQAATASLMRDAMQVVTVRVMLYTAGPPFPDQDSLIGDFTEADFTGYDRYGPIVVIIAGEDGEGNNTTSTGEVHFQADDPIIVSNTIVGAVVYDAVAAEILMVLPFVTPIVVANNGQVLQLGIKFVAQEQTPYVDIIG